MTQNNEKKNKIYKNSLAISSKLIYTIVIMWACNSKALKYGGKSLMKTFKKFLAVMMAALIVLSLSSCDLIQDAEITPAVGTVTDAKTKKEVPVTGIEAGDVRIGILFADDVEREDTVSYMQKEQINTMMRTFSIAGTINKNKVDSTIKHDIEDAIISCVKESGCNVVLSTDPAFTAVMYEFSQKEDYKNIAFTCLDGTKEYESTANFNCFYPDYAQAYALAGIAAASKSDDATISLTEENAEYLEAFTLGVKAVNPSAKVVSGEKIETYGTINTNWYIYYMALVESLTLGKFEEMGNYFKGVEVGFCDFEASEEYMTEDGEDNMSDAKLKINEGAWDFAQKDTIKF